MERQMEGVPFDTEMAFHNPGNPMARISEIAARLGVAPRERFDVATVIAEGLTGSNTTCLKSPPRSSTGWIRQSREAWGFS
jgi:hypothetical protein